MQDKIFVYGSLMAPAPSQIGQTLRGMADFVGEALVGGVIYDLGRYPGLVLSKKPGDRVRGHLYRMRDPAALLPILDEYEGSASGDPEKNEYRRVLIQVDRQGEAVFAWAYLYNFATDSLARIPNGDYLAFMAKNEAYRRFLDSV